MASGASDATGRAQGRPRDTTIDERALAAARELLATEGLAATTVQAVAHRSGVHASAIYRRWPTRADLLYDAAFADLPPGRVRPTGDLRQDLRRFLKAYVKTFETPVVRAALPALFGGAAREGAGSPATWSHLSVRPQFRDLLDAAEPPIDSTVEADHVFDLALGAVLVRVLVPAAVRTPTPIDDTVDLLLRVLRPTDHA
jgi:AcrR family transcriptional regulator